MNLNNIEGLREMLADQIKKTVEGEQTPAVLDSLANASGKMISATKVQLEYAKLVGGTPSIEFLNGDWLKR